ncbi:hypothetical protein DIPPA_04436 [Diplonema papillatum]|nr:hypothetical protein DIPPA_04436 [Diplonema papillatum]|eukprot:gene3266-5116_t
MCGGAGGAADVVVEMEDGGSGDALSLWLAALAQCLEFADGETLWQCGQVDREWRRLSVKESLWQDVVKRGISHRVAHRKKFSTVPREVGYSFRQRWARERRWDSRVRALNGEGSAVVQNFALLPGSCLTVDHIGHPASHDSTDGEDPRPNVLPTVSFHSHTAAKTVETLSPVPVFGCPTFAVRHTSESTDDILLAIAECVHPSRIAPFRRLLGAYPRFTMYKGCTSFALDDSDDNISSSHDVTVFYCVSTERVVRILLHDATNRRADRGFVS